jgi:hypothetical protein
MWLRALSFGWAVPFLGVDREFAVVRLFDATTEFCRCVNLFVVDLATDVCGLTFTGRPYVGRAPKE